MDDRLPYFTGTICSDCAKLHGLEPATPVATFYMGECGLCAENKTVTETRDYKGWVKDPVRYG